MTNHIIREVSPSTIEYIPKYKPNPDGAAAAKEWAQQPHIKRIKAELAALAAAEAEKKHRPPYHIRKQLAAAEMEANGRD